MLSDGRSIARFTKSNRSHWSFVFSRQFQPNDTTSSSSVSNVGAYAVDTATVGDLELVGIKDNVVNNVLTFTDSSDLEETTKTDIDIIDRTSS